MNTAKEIADRLGISEATIREWGRIGKIPRIVLSPKIIRYDWDSVLQSLKREKSQHGNDKQ